MDKKKMQKAADDLTEEFVEILKTKERTRETVAGLIAACANVLVMASRALVGNKMAEDVVVTAISGAFRLIIETEAEMRREGEIK